MHAWYMQGLCRGQGDVLARISRHAPMFFHAHLQICRLADGVNQLHSASVYTRCKSSNDSEKKTSLNLTYRD